MDILLTVLALIQASVWLTSIAAHEIVQFGIESNVAWKIAWVLVELYERRLYLDNWYRPLRIVYKPES